MSVEIFILMMLFASGIWVIGGPLYQKKKLNSQTQTYQLKDLSLRKQEIMDSLKDLELDYQMAKVDETDFKKLYDESIEEGASILAQMDVVSKKSSALEASVTNQKVQSNTAEESSSEKGDKFCCQCGEPLRQQARYCGQCGVKIE